MEEIVSLKSENTTTNKSRRILRILILLAIIGSIYWLANAFGLAKSGFTDPQVLSTYNFYLNSAFGFILGLISLFFIELFITYKDSTYGNGIGFSDQGEYPAIPFFKKLSMFQIFLIFMILFMILGLFIFKGSSKQVIFGDINPIPKEQFTPIGGVIWSNLLIPLSENLGLALFIALELTIFRWVGRKYNMSKGNFIVSVYVVGILGSGIYGWVVHLMRYQGQETSLFVVLIFWMIMGVLTLLTGSFIPGWSMHYNNNFFGDISSLISNKDLIFYMMIGVVILLVISYLYLYVFKKKSKNKLMK